MTDEIKPFELALPPESGVFKRLTGRISREAAFVNIRNLLATGPFNEVTVGEVTGFLSRAKLDAREVVNDLMAIYQQAALILAADRDLTAADRAALDNLQHAFQLTDSEASAARADATADIFRRTIREAAADGRWSPADQATADATVTALGIPEKQAREVFETAAVTALRTSYAAAVADRRLSGSEDAQLNALAASLGITVKFDAQATAIADRFRQLAAIEDGVLPSVPVSIMLQRGELCHFTAAGIVHKEMRVVTKRVNYGGPTLSIPIYKGLRWRMGSIAVSRVTQDVLTQIDKVDVYLTNKRVFLQGGRKNTTVALKKIVHFTVYSDGLQIEKDAGKDLYLLGESDWELAGACLEAVASASR